MLVGLTGFAGVGKDTVAGLLVERGFRQYAFADKVKEVAVALAPQLMLPSGVSLQNVLDKYGSLEAAKRVYPGVRDILKAIGGAGDGSSGLKRVLGADIWVRALVEQVQEEFDWSFAKVCEFNNIVISDVSFELESELIDDFGGVLVEVIRPGFNGRRVDGPVADTTHAVKLINAGGLAELSRSVDELVEGYCG
jgi:hypothetical protein